MSEKSKTIWIVVLAALLLLVFLLLILAPRAPEPVAAGHASGTIDEAAEFELPVPESVQPIVLTPSPAPTTSPEPLPINRDYVLNNNTKRFHYPECPSVKEIAPKNYCAYFGTREALIADGFVPCGNCNP